MNISEAGLELIKDHEGCVLTAYPDPGTGGDPWTIGYGSTRGVQQGMMISREEADARLREDVHSAEQCVNRSTDVILTQNQFDALVSFVFNVGCKAFQGSTLLRKLNAGDVDGAANEFQRWNKGGGKVLPGLVVRRKSEEETFRA